MPWEQTENEIRHPIRPVSDFQDGSFRRITLQKDKPRVFAIIGRPKGKTTTAIQALRFPKEDGWTVAKAKRWLKDHPDLKEFSMDKETKEVLNLSFKIESL